MKIRIDLPSVANKSGDDSKPIVKGFDTERILLSGFKVGDKVVADIKAIHIYDWNHSPDSDNPDAVIPASAIIPEADGTFTIEKSALVDADGNPVKLTMIRSIVFDCNEFNGNKAGSMTIRLDGKTDWFDDLDAKLTFAPENETMKNCTTVLTNRLHVDRPVLSVHGDVEYFANNKSVSSTYTANTDQNLMSLAVPYDRDFSYLVNVENTGVSVLDDVDLKVTLPINDSSAGAEANTGFHTTGIEISRALLEQFQEIESITFCDADDTAGKKFIYTKADGATSGEFVLENGTASFGSGSGDIALTEADLIAWCGIHNLRSILITGKKFQVTGATKELWIKFHGFSDSVFGTTNTMVIDGINYLDGLRDVAAFASKTIDRANA